MMRGKAHRGCGEKTGFGILVESGCPVAGGGLFAEEGIGILQGFGLLMSCILSAPLMIHVIVLFVCKQL